MLRSLGNIVDWLLRRPSDKGARKWLPQKVYRAARRALHENGRPVGEVRVESYATGTLVQVWLPRGFKHGSMNTSASSHDAWVELVEVIGWIMSLGVGQADAIKTRIARADEPSCLMVTVRRMEDDTLLVRVLRREGQGASTKLIVLEEEWLT